VTLIPTRATFAPGERVVLQRDGALPATTAEVLHLDEVVASVRFAAGQDRLVLPPFPVGGYAVRAGEERTAFDVLADPFDRPRYGFVVRMTDDVDRDAVVRFFRRAHLSIAQFYDWAYRHSQLMPPTPAYVDPLGQQRTISGVDGLARALRDAGTTPLGYSAVYGVGADERERWEPALLRRADGEPYRFGDDFLLLVDPAHPLWIEHYLAQLAAVLDGTAFAGFHLDQYGWPKRAADATGAEVDVADSFVRLLERVRERLPHSRFMFNNVNDFPVERTAAAPQDATYIEVWDPHSELGDLGALALKARALRPEHPPILSAYLSCYADGDAVGADAAARLTMATIFSHGATHLLLGEDGRALTDPYYPRNYELVADAQEGFVRWYDFAVRYGDLLLDPGQTDVTEQFTGGVNDDIVLESDEPAASTKARPGTVWTRVVRTRAGIVVHLINLTGQDDVRWDAVKHDPVPVAGLRLRVVPATADDPAPLVADPEDGPDLAALAEVEPAATESDPFGGSQAVRSYALPPLRTWAMVWFPRRHRD
jgi:dextranase